MPAVPTRPIAHRALVRDREVPATRSLCLGARNHVPQYPGPHVPGRISGHCWWPSKTNFLSGGASRKPCSPSNLGRPKAVERLDGTEAGPGQVNNKKKQKQQRTHSCRNKIELSRVESNYWRPSTHSPAAHRAYKSNSISTVTISMSPVMSRSRSRLPTIDGSPHCSRPCHSSLDALQAASHCL